MFEDDDTSYVYVKEHGRITRRNIKVGLNGAEYVEIKSGLQEGEPVFLNPVPEKSVDKKL